MGDQRLGSLPYTHRMAHGQSANSPETPPEPSKAISLVGDSRESTTIDVKLSPARGWYEIESIPPEQRIGGTSGQTPVEWKPKLRTEPVTLRFEMPGHQQIKQTVTL